jgi:ABC-type antimicrobial peptide transport system permease subunit
VAAVFSLALGLGAVSSVYALIRALFDRPPVLTAAILLAAVSLAACSIPAWRAARVEPTQALRQST